MLRLTNLEGQTLSFGNEKSYNQDDERALTLYLDKMFRAADLKNKLHVGSLQKNMNLIAGRLIVGRIPEDGIVDAETAQAFQYFIDNRDLFIKNGVSEFLNAKKLEHMVSPAFAEGEHAPTIEEMKKLEIDINELYKEEEPRLI